MQRAASPSPRIILAVLSLGGISYALLQSLVIPALPQIQSSLHTSESAVGWVLTAYLLSASVATPIIGRLGDMYGKERMLMIVLLMLAFGTLISAIASSLWLMILGRVIQGAGGGIFPLAFSIIRDEFPNERVPGVDVQQSVMVANTVPPAQATTADRPAHAASGRSSSA